MKDRKYELLLDQMLRVIESRDGRSPQSVADACTEEMNESLYREAICQILVTETRGRRMRILSLYPELMVPFLLRIRRP